MSCWQNSLFQFLLLPVIIITALSIDIKNNASTIPNDGRIVAYELYECEQVIIYIQFQLNIFIAEN